MAMLGRPLRPFGSRRPYQGHSYASCELLPVRLPLSRREASNEARGAVPEERSSPSVADTWAVEVWSMPAAPTPTHTTNIVFGIPPRLGDSLTTVQHDELHPANISTSAWVQYLQSNLRCRQAALQLVQAIVLNGPYLPSQIDFVSRISNKLQLCTTCFISKQQLHVVVSRQSALQTSSDDISAAAQPKHPEHSWIPLLSSELGVNVQPLPEGRMKAARDAEQLLLQQMRLYSPGVWTTELQQKLLTRKRVQTVIAVRSLMSPADLAAVRKLVDKVGLYLLEVERELPMNEADSHRGRRSSSSSSGSRRRIKQPSSTGADSLAFEGNCGSACEKELVLVVSVSPFAPADFAGLPEHIPPTAFSDYEPDYSADPKAKDSQNNKWWHWEFWKWIVRPRETS